MFEKYIVIKESNIIAKQTSNGIWYCSELPAKNVKELDVLIGEVNKVLNNYNKNGVVKKPTPTSENVNYGFQLDGRINAETLDDAVDIIELILGDNGIVVNKISIIDKDGVLTEAKVKSKVRM